MGVPVVAQRVTNPTSIHADVGLIPGPSGLRIPGYCELQFRLQMLLGSGFAVVVV